MKFQRHQADEINVNLTPLIDVVFLLLIFFMVSTSFSRETQLQLDLPSASGDAVEADDAVIDIGIGRHGELAINGRALSSNDKARLRDALKQVAGETQPSIVVSADAQSPHQAFVDVMDVAASLGFSRLAIAAQQEEN